MDKFEQWFINQDFYTNMRFIHGDALFIKDGDVYRVLPVQMVWVAWQSRQVEVDLINATHHGQMIGHDVFVKQLKERHAKQVQGLAKAISKFEKEMDEKDKRIEAAMSLIQAWNDQGYRDDAEQLINVDLVEALRGERE